MSRPIGVGLIGFGMSGRVLHGPLLTAHAAYDLRVVADPRADGIGERLPRVRVVPDLASVLRDGDVELVIVATPNATHHRLATRALRAGRHVVVEKPMTPTVGEADRLIAAAEAAGRVLSVFHSRRWDDDYRTVCDVVASGRLGTVRRYIARFEFFAQPGPDDWRRSAGPGSGLLYDVGSHLIDQALALFGQPESVTARLTAAPGRPDQAFTLILEAAGTEILLLGSERTVLASPTFEVHGDAGSLIVDGGRDRQERILEAGLDPRTGVQGAAPARLAVPVGGSVELEAVTRSSSTYLTYYGELARSIRDGVPPPVTAQEGRDTIRVISAAQRSARIGRTVRLD